MDTRNSVADGIGINIRELREMSSVERAPQDIMLTYIKKVESLNVKLEEARRQISDWRNLETQHMNELNEVKKKARELANELFTDNTRHGW